MGVLCLFIPHLPVQFESNRHPELAQMALVIGGFPQQRKRTVDCSEEAARCGISPGTPLRQAHHLCPDAVFLPLDKAGYAAAFEEVLDILDQFTPVVEVDCLDKAFIDVSGTEKLFGPTECLAEELAREVLCRTGFRSRIGIANNKFVASVAASLASAGPLIVKSGEEKIFLEPLSIEVLPISQEARGWLDRLGLRTVGDIASLPLDALAGQLGAEGVVAQRLANGMDKSPLRPSPKPDVLEGNLCIERPLENMDMLLVAASGLLDRLVLRLKSRQQVCRKMKLRLRFEGGGSWHNTLSLKIPTDSRRDIVARLKHSLERARFPGGISEIYIGLSQLSSEYARQCLLSTDMKGSQEEALLRLASELEDSFGQSLLKKVVQLDPSCRIPERRLALGDLSSTDVGDSSTWSRHYMFR